MSNNNLAKNLASEVGDLTRVPTDADDHLKLLAAKCEAKDFSADFDAEYLTVPKTGEVAKKRSFKHPTEFKIYYRSEWAEQYPVLREFLQNAFDHLCLIDAHGLRLPHVQLHVEGTPTDYSIAFRIGDISVLTLRAEDADTLQIRQSHTYPLPLDALGFRVSDDVKRLGTGAGGFGLGFKEAIAALLESVAHDGGDGGNGDGAVVYHMFTRTHRIEWTFNASEPKKSVRGYQRLRTLEPRVKVAPAAAAAAAAAQVKANQEKK